MCNFAQLFRCLERASLNNPVVLVHTSFVAVGSGEGSTEGSALHAVLEFWLVNFYKSRGKM